MANHSKLLMSTPILPALDIDQTFEFYQQKLGFTRTNDYPDYLIFERDGVYLHLGKYTKFTPQTNPFSCYIYVENIEPLYQEYRAQGAIHPDGALVDTPWGMKEFVVLDPNGNLVRVGERLKTA